MVVKLPKAPGAREARWAHLLCGPVDTSVPHAGVQAGGSSQARIEALEAEVAQLRATVTLLCQELGVSPPGQSE